LGRKYPVPLQIKVGKKAVPENVFFGEIARDRLTAEKAFVRFQVFTWSPFWPRTSIL
jgi:hypothetical protein